MCAIHSLRKDEMETKTGLSNANDLRAVLVPKVLVGSIWVWADVGGGVRSLTSRGGTSAVNSAWRVPVTTGVQDIRF